MYTIISRKLLRAWFWPLVLVSFLRGPFIMFYVFMLSLYAMFPSSNALANNGVSLTLNRTILREIYALNQTNIFLVFCYRYVSSVFEVFSVALSSRYSYYKGNELSFYFIIVCKLSPIVKQFVVLSFSFVCLF